MSDSRSNSERPSLVKKRWFALEQAMNEADYDVVLIYGKGIITQYGYLTYFGNYFPVLRPGYIVYARGHQPIVFYSTRADWYLAKETGTIEDVRFVGTGDVIQSEKGLLGEVAQTIRGYKPKKVGIVGLHSMMNNAEYRLLVSNIDAHIEDATRLAALIKAKKYPEEAAGIREAFELAERSFQAFRDVIRPGVTPAEAAAEVERIARSNGAIDTLIFVEEGPYFLRKPTLKPLQNNKLITAYVELIAPNGYWVEKAGMFALGTLSERAQAVGQACVAAMQEVKTMLKPGVTVGEVAAVISRHAAANRALTGIWHGHGIGVDHDLPIVADNGTEQIEEGMAISIHPNFADEAEGVGASIADVFIVGKDGAEGLSKLSYEMVQL